MAQFLTTKGVSYHLEEIIKGASEHLVIISPYLRIDDHTKELLEGKEIEINVIYGKKDLKPKEKIWLDSMEHIRLSFRRNLHAKCYLNEDYALLTSMNLNEFSQVNNDELYGNDKRKEKHCHTCGKEHGTSMKKPLCFACYRKYKDVLEFAAS